jgi:hypothetical protein
MSNANSTYLGILGSVRGSGTLPTTIDAGGDSDAEMIDLRSALFCRSRRSISDNAKLWCGETILALRFFDRNKLAVSSELADSRRWMLSGRDEANREHSRSST